MFVKHLYLLKTERGCIEYKDGVVNCGQLEVEVARERKRILYVDREAEVAVDVVYRRGTVSACLAC